MTPSLPPRSSRAGAASSASRSASGSSFTAMRSAWKVRVATWVRRDQAARGTPALTASTRSAVIVSGERRRRSTMRFAMRRAWRSSPYSKRMRASSASVASASRSAAVRPRVGSKRMSSGSSFWKLNPRPEASSW